MISETLYPKTKQDLVRSLQRQRISQIEIIEPYDPAEADELTKVAKQMFNRPGDVTIVLLRTQ